jgi:hypothetical protein
MAIEVAGRKPVGAKKITLVVESELDLPKKTEENIHEILDFLPLEHRRGIEKLKLVDFIEEGGLKEAKGDFKDNLPYMYYPRMQNKSARMEISMMSLLKPLGKFTERWMAKSSFKSSLASAIFVMVGQHYYLTMKHSVKKDNLQAKIQRYAQENLRNWSEQQSEKSWRGKIFKPLRPLMERWAKWLNKKATQKK